MTSPSFHNDLILARRELELERRRVQLLRENQIAFYRPHEKQAAFHLAAWARYRYARTGNRFGKSEMGAAEDVAFALGYRPWIPEGVTLRTLGMTEGIAPEYWDVPLRTLGIPQHPTKGLIVCTTWAMSRKVFTECENGIALGKLFKYIPRDRIGKPTKNHSGFIDRIPVRHISGEWSIILIATIEGFKNNELSQESDVHDWVHVDEPIPRAMWNAIARGLVDRGGHAWFTCTPLTEPWIDDAFVPDMSLDREAESISFSHKDRWMMTGSMTDNPHNDPKDIDSFLAWLTDDEKDARLNGLPTSFAGLVFKEFSWKDHVLNIPPAGWSERDGVWIPPRNWCIRIAIDYHFRKNDAVLFIATSPQEISVCYAELWRQMLLDEEVKLIKETCGTHPFQPVLVDPLASTPNKVTEITAMDEYRRLGLPVLPATKDPVNGIRAVKSNLKARDKHGRPVLFFASHLSRTLMEIARGFVWDSDQNKPKKINDDMMENLHRLSLQGLTYIEPADDNAYIPYVPSDFSQDSVTLPSDTPAASVEERAKRLRRSARYRSNGPDGPAEGYEAQRERTALQQISALKLN